MSIEHGIPKALLSQSQNSTGMPEESWMSYVLQGKALVSPDGRLIPRSVMVLPTKEVQVVALDIGNDAAKVGIVDHTLHFQCVRIPTTYQPSKAIRHGDGKTEWRVLDGTDHEAFWIGTDAVNAGDSLPIGPTHQRLSDARYIRFLRAALIESLIAGGYTPGAYTLAVGIGLRNEEIEETNGKQVIEPNTLYALKLLKGAFEIERIDSRGTVAKWSITISNIFPAAQTLGSFFAWYYNLQGQPSQHEIKKIAILDYGGGDTHLLEVEHNGRRLTVTGERLGDGTVEIARGLVKAVKQQCNITLTIAAAQQALAHGTILVSGRDTSIAPLIATLKLSRVENLLGRTLPVLQNGDAYLMHSGGGASLMNEEIQNRMQMMHRASNDYLIVPLALASILNCVGLYAFAYYRLMTSAQR